MARDLRLHKYSILHPSHAKLARYLTIPYLNCIYQRQWIKDGIFVSAEQPRASLNLDKSCGHFNDQEQSRHCHLIVCTYLRHWKTVSWWIRPCKELKILRFLLLNFERSEPSWLSAEVVGNQGVPYSARAAMRTYEEALYVKRSIVQIILRYWKW